MMEAEVLKVNVLPITASDDIIDIDWDSTILEKKRRNPVKRYRTSVQDEMNESIDWLRTKLFADDDDSIVPVKRRNVSLKEHIEVDTGQYPFYGLPNEVKELMKKHNGIEKLYEWQEECLDLKAVHERRNLIYALPTSGGKTLVAEILMLKEVLCRKKNAMFVLPFVALVQEKIQSLTPFALGLNFLIEEYAAEKGHYPPRKRRSKTTIYVCTIEKAQSLINCLIELDRLNELGIVVIDELHLLGESGGRGATLECLLTKVMHSDSSIPIIGMSATIGNLKEVAAFLNAEVYVRNFRPVSFKEYVKCENEIWLIDYNEEEMFTDKKIINYKYSSKALQIDPDCLGGFVMDVVPKDSCLIFCPSKRNCENVSLLLTQVLFTSLQSHRVDEKNILLKTLETEGGRLCPVLKRTIKFGVAYHHSGLTAEERKLIEEAFKSGILCVLCCTSTLAAGVNLPARRVILRSPYVGADFLNLSRYKQMIGRAGRAGFGEIGESILICNKSDTDKVRKLLSSKMNDTTSSLHTEVDRGINNLIISSVLLSTVTTRLSIHELISKTLLQIQEDKLGINVKQIVDKALTQLLNSGILRVKQTNTANSPSDLNTSVIFPSQIVSSSDENDTSLVMTKNSPANEKKKNKIYTTLVNSTEIELCPLGRAAMKGSIDLYTAHVLYQDLQEAQKNLVLVDYLHLLYLLTPYNIANQVKPVGTVYYDVITKLNPYQMQVARLLGITEAIVDKLRAGFLSKQVNEKVVQRFYVTLMLYDLWNQESVFSVADKFQVNRGTIQNLLSSAASFSYSIVRFCQELDEFWAFTDLFTSFGHKLQYCCASELEPLMELPYVKQGRAKQLYKAGYKTLQSIAKSKPDELLNKMEHLPRKVASQIISAAKLLLLEKVENLKDEVAAVLDGVDL
ncbi:helicase POLQ-like [Copidosoma floridanum]|uniref:helicase POLQ-like n=1 Tax=Copidosoma floridanum TaxID=29053 RepID=UPI0006C9689C|nr:helicase POLQ-like [Copidosoma floridanum]